MNILCRMEICPWQSLTSASLSCLKKCSFLLSFEQVTLCSFKLGFGCLPIPERMGGEVAICSQSKQLFQSPAAGNVLRDSTASPEGETASPCSQEQSGTPAEQRRAELTCEWSCGVHTPIVLLQNEGSQQKNVKRGAWWM